MGSQTLEWGYKLGFVSETAWLRKTVEWRSPSLLLQDSTVGALP